jgi:hypothetical protein
VDGIRLSDYDRGFIAGLMIGEASFGTDGRGAAVVVRMHVRHEKVLRRLLVLLPGSKLYGPYTHDGRTYLQWMLRGEALTQALGPLLQEIAALDDHVAARIARMQRLDPRLGTRPAAVA